MSWPEVSLAKAEKRHEIVLSGSTISARIQKDGVDNELFALIGLNYLSLTDTCLDKVSSNISCLSNLQTLVLHSNKLTEITSEITELSKLKVLDLSQNQLKSIPENLSDLKELVSLNVSFNKLEKFPKFSNNPKLSTINAANNNLIDFLDVCYPENVHLSEINVSGNEIESISSNIFVLASLKVLKINANKVKIIPGELADCSKLKELDLKDNPISDKRLLKMVNQCHFKQIIDYIRQHCPRSKTEISNGKVGKKSKKNTKNKKDSESSDTKEEISKEIKYKVHVERCTDDCLKIIIDPEVKEIRAHIIACIVRNIEFTEDLFRKFIQLQTKLHDSVCDKRNSATIATHDLKKLPPGSLKYTVKTPEELQIKPLNRTVIMTGKELFSKLQAEADALRKEKKRNTYSGIHKFLYLLEGRKKYPCFLNATGEVISFPPITNSDISKMTLDTKDLLLEVTSNVSQPICKRVMDNLIKEMVLLFDHDLKIEQVKIVDDEGNLKVIYPAKNDLVFDNSIPIAVELQ
ncbi:leucine-rich repeat-containing protein 47-like [Agrilus planipennis]|uniref:Leucine-rich repeat-containing protein 47-like n=1 Tax=Agrilus planipennis TaxID=224129 RepID=A0A1W4XC59_AGRPL|nr:leucine-rich repeat-containing protein 47-like [Agrilus planipennis]